MSKNLGIYIHIPFCASKCAYCDFYSHANCDSLMPKYHNAIIDHIKEAGPQLRRYYVDTVYFGGGTPSYYGAKRICEIFNALKMNALVYRSAEVTIEVNPGTVTAEKLKEYKSVGINRLSIGLQTTQPDLLKQIGRIHDFEEFLETYEIARSVGFNNINVDLMLGLPNQRIKDIKESLGKIIELEPEHISVYSLIIEEGTPIANKIEKGDCRVTFFLYCILFENKFLYNITVEHPVHQNHNVIFPVIQLCPDN